MQPRTPRPSARSRPRVLAHGMILFVLEVVPLLEGKLSNTSKVKTVFLFFCLWLKFSVLVCPLGL